MLSTQGSGGIVVEANDLRAVLDGDYGYVRDLVREQLTRPEFAPVYDIDRDEYQERVFRQMKELAKEGGTGLGFPEEYGGGDDVGASVTGFETLAHGDLSLLVKCGVQFGLFGGAIYHLGTEKHHKRYLPDVMTVDLPGGFAMTETGHGSNVQDLRTTATYDPDIEQFVINTPDLGARKDYIGNVAKHGRMVAAFAQLHTAGEDRGVHCFVVPIRDDDGEPLEGVTIEDCGLKMGLRGVDNGRICFDDVRIPRENLLDRYAEVQPDGTYFSPIEDQTKRFFTMVGTLVQGRVSIAGAGISATKNALSIAIRYGERRRQFGPPGADHELPILDYLAHQRRLLPRLARTYALHFGQRELVDDLHRSFSDPDFPERERRKLESRAAGIKALSTWHATDTIQTCREACGGAGYLSENLLGQLKADTDVFTTFEGDNTVLLQLVAKGLLTDYQEEFEQLTLAGMAMFVADQAVSFVVERSDARPFIQQLIDAVPGRDEDADLRDRGYHLRLLEWREEHILDGIGRRLARGIQGGEDPFEVFNRAQDHVLLAARAHVERIVLEAFVTAVERCDDEELSQLLGKVCDLHALSLIEQERGWFQEHQRLSSHRAKNVIEAVNDLCAELRPHARLLVDAWGIPDAAIAAPIAIEDGLAPSNGH